MSDLKTEALERAAKIIYETDAYVRYPELIEPAIAAALLRERAEEADRIAATMLKGKSGEWAYVWAHRAAELRAAASELEGK